MYLSYRPSHFSESYCVFKGSLCADPDKIRAIVEWSKSWNIRELRSFHGLTTFYRWFSWNFSTFMVLITDCLKQEKFRWTLLPRHSEKSREDDESFCYKSSRFFKSFWNHLWLLGHGIRDVLSQEKHLVVYLV